MRAVLLSHTQYPLGTILSAWMMNRGDLRSPEEWESILRGEISFYWQSYGDSPEDARRRLRETVRGVIEDNLPPCELVEFVWGLYDIPIALREQLVRHRVGCRTGSSEWIWTLPDLDQSSFWVQSSRAVNLSEFRYFVPQSIQSSPDLLEEYQEAMERIREVYKRLSKKAPLEDVRYLLPLGVTHHMVWGTNLRTLQNIVQARSCWLVQAELWGKIILDIVKSLREIDPLLGAVIRPPCYSRRKYKSCVWISGVEERIRGDDPNPPCPLAMVHERSLREVGQTSSHWRLRGAQQKLSNWEAPDSYSAVRFSAQLEYMRDLWGGEADLED